MTTPVTVLAPITLATGHTEAELLAASATFQAQFVDHEPGVLRRELVRTGPGTYLDIVRFRDGVGVAIVPEYVGGDADVSVYVE